MTMLTSLKALLFPAAMPGAARGGGVAAPAEAAVDFGQMLDVAKGGGAVSRAAPILSASPAMPEQQKEGGGAVAANVSNLVQSAVPSHSAVVTKVPGEQAGFAMPATDVEAGPPVPVADMGPATPVAAANPRLPVADDELATVAVMPSAPLASDMQPEMAVAALADTATETPSVQPVAQPVSARHVRGDLTSEASTLEAEPDTLSIDSEDDHPVEPDDALPAADQPIPTAMMPTVAPMPAVQPALQSMPAVQPALQSTPAEVAGTGNVATAALTPALPAANEPAAPAAVPTAPQIAPPASASQSDAAVPVQAALALPVEVPAVPQSADGAKPAVAQTLAMPIPSAPISSAVPRPTESAAGLADQAVAPSTGQPARDPSKPAPVKAEAVSLLQLVRDHMHGRAAPRTSGPASEGKSVGAREVATETTAAPLPAVPANDRTSAPLSQTPVIATAQPSPVAPSTVDLSASIGAQVVDMGVSGQWIDGLARDIAGLSANGAQGRFQISAEQLGPVQVDIRQGDDGAAISLTVATEAAELALRQESERLKIDAGLSAVRISEVKVERAPNIAEPVRSETQNNQSGSQSQSQGQSASWQGQGAGMGQSSAQSHMQGRGQQRENIALNHKGSSDPAVLNHERAGVATGDLPRARYA